jgi:hypothetical protein
MLKLPRSLCSGASWSVSVPLLSACDASVAGMTRKRHSSSTTALRFLLRQMRCAWTSFVSMCRSPSCRSFARSLARQR